MRANYSCPTWLTTVSFSHKPTSRGAFSASARGGKNRSLSANCPHLANIFLTYTLKIEKAGVGSQTVRSNRCQIIFILESKGGLMSTRPLPHPQTKSITHLVQAFICVISFICNTDFAYMLSGSSKYASCFNF